MDAIKAPISEKVMIDHRNPIVVGTDTPTSGVWTEVFHAQVPVNQTWVFTPDMVTAIYLETLNDPLAAAIADDGGAFTIETVEGNNAAANDMTLQPAAEVLNDAYYFGSRYPFAGIEITYSTAAVDGGTAEAVWEVYDEDAAAWQVPMGVVDGTAATAPWTAAAGTYTVNWTPSPSHGMVAINGHTLYWVRSRVTVADFAQPLGDQAWIGGAIEASGTDLVRMMILDASGRNARIILQCRYSQMDEWANVNSMRHYDINQAVEAKAGDRVIVEVFSRSGRIDASECRLQFEVERWRDSFR